MINSADNALRASIGLPVAGQEDDQETETERVAVTLQIVEIPSALKVEDNDAATDYTKARSLLYAQLKLVGDITAEAGELAKQTLNPRAFDAFAVSATLLRTLTQDLLSMQKTFKDIKKGDEALERGALGAGGTTTNNISQTFVGSPAELAALIAQTNRTLDAAVVVQDISEK